jgi:hypothetical protein
MRRGIGQNNGFQACRAACARGQLDYPSHPSGAAIVVHIPSSVVRHLLKQPIQPAVITATLDGVFNRIDRVESK